MKVEAREKALLQLVEEHRDRECRRIRENARRRADAMLKQSFEKQRLALHQRVSAERSRAHTLIEAARAERATRERRLGEQRDEAVLAAVWPALRAALLARWQEPGQRQDWVLGALECAVELLPRGDWLVRHAPDLSEDELVRWFQVTSERIGQAPRFLTDPSIGAGLIIACHGAVLDASLEGLLADRHRLEARALALWKDARTSMENPS
jgi:hypothetical protein